MPEVSKAAGYPSSPIASEYPKKPVEQAVTSTVPVTLTKVPVPAYTPAPYPTAGGAPYVPAGPAKNATSMYAPMPTGTGKPTMPSSYAPPAEFTGAASRTGAGFMMLVGVVGAMLVL
jgi:chitinase